MTRIRITMLIGLLLTLGSSSGILWVFGFSFTHNEPVGIRLAQEGCKRISLRDFVLSVDPYIEAQPAILWANGKVDPSFKDLNEFQKYLSNCGSFVVSSNADVFDAYLSFGIVSLLFDSSELGDHVRTTSSIPLPRAVTPKLSYPVRNFYQSLRLSHHLYPMQDGQPVSHHAVGEELLAPGPSYSYTPEELQSRADILTQLKDRPGLIGDSVTFHMVFRSPVRKIGFGHRELQLDISASSYGEDTSAHSYGARISIDESGPLTFGEGIREILSSGGPGSGVHVKTERKSLIRYEIAEKQQFGQILTLCLAALFGIGVSLVAEAFLASGIWMLRSRENN